MRKYTLLTILASVFLLCPAASVLQGPGTRATAFPTANLISYWKLDETSGTRVDSVIATGNDLTDNNTVTSNPGKIGNAAQFTAANSEYLSHVDNASLSTGDIDFTFTCWVYLDSTSARRPFITKWNGGTNQREYFLEYNNTDNLFKWLVSSDGTASSSRTAATFGAPTINTWYFIACGHDSVGNTIWISVNNGAVDTTSTSLGAFDGTTVFAIGGYPEGAGLWDDGRIDEVAFWKRKLTTAELLTVAGRTYP